MNTGRAVVAVAFSALLFGAGWYVGGGQKGTADVASKGEDSFETRAHRLENEVRLLKQQLSDREADLESVNQTVLHQKKLIVEQKNELALKRTRAANTSANAQPSRSQVKPEELVKLARDSASRIRERSREEEGFDFRQEIISSYENEPVDETWASEHRALLTDYFEVGEGLEGAVIKSLSCRSKRCRVELYYQTKDEVSNIADSLNKLVMESGDSGFVPTIFTAYFEDEQTASLYLTDDVGTPFF